MFKEHFVKIRTRYYIAGQQIKREMAVVKLLETQTKRQTNSTKRVTAMKIWHGSRHIKVQSGTVKKQL